jgi:methylphosphotriester-DNA--protein-cysteine methyltransferase
MIKQTSVTPTQLRSLIRSGKLAFAGNQRLKIYGKLNCSSGKRMKKQNRVFFQNEGEALMAGYRPCGHCLEEKYLVWK